MNFRVHSDLAVSMLCTRNRFLPENGRDRKWADRMTVLMPEDSFFSRAINFLKRLNDLVLSYAMFLPLSNCLKSNLSSKIELLGIHCEFPSLSIALITRTFIVKTKSICIKYIYVVLSSEILFKDRSSKRKYYNVLISNRILNSMVRWKSLIRRFRVKIRTRSFFVHGNLICILSKFRYILFPDVDLLIYKAYLLLL